MHGPVAEGMPPATEVADLKVDCSPVYEMMHRAPFPAWGLVCLSLINNKLFMFESGGGAFVAWSSTPEPARYHAHRTALTTEGR